MDVDIKLKFVKGMKETKNCSDIHPKYLFVSHANEYLKLNDMHFIPSYVKISLSDE